MNLWFRRLLFVCIVWIAFAMPDAVGADSGEEGSTAVLLYHRFGEPRHAAASVELDLFDQHLAELTSGRYELLSVPMLTERLKAGGSLPRRGVAVTIDDGFRSVYTEAWPRLRAAGVPFTLYIAPELLNLGSRDYMTWDELREMAADPLVTIGSHGFAHDSMIEMPPSLALADLALAAQRLQKELGETPRSFAYPYGEYGLALRDLVSESGLAAAFGTQSGPVVPDSDRFALPRFPIGGSHAEMERFRLVVNTLPLPLRWLAPRDPLLDPQRWPQPVVFQLEGAGRGDAPTCYFGNHLLPLEADGDNAFSSLLPGPMAKGRHRINCTRPGPEGRWRWTGLQIYVPRGMP